VPFRHAIGSNRSESGLSEAFVMNRATIKPKAYLKEGCPYSFKYLLFMTEAGLLDQVDVVRCDPESAEFDAVKQKLSEATGREATFPTVEIAPKRYLSDSDKLIAHYARVCNVDWGTLPTLSFYTETLFPQLAASHE
jgi:hypothetical protein